jgi:hypothetical protein
MFWFWVGLACAIVLGLAAWSTLRSRRIRGSARVTSDGVFYRPRDGASAADSAEARAEINSTRPDHHPGGAF